MNFIKENILYISLILGILAGYPLVRNVNHQFSLKTGRQVFLRCCLFTVVSVASVMLFASLEGLLSGQGFHFGAVSTYGLYLIAPLFLLLLLRRESRAYFDGYALYVLPSMILQRIKCLIEGCCYGKLIGTTGWRYPTREMEIVFYIVMILVLKKHNNNDDGRLFPLLMVSYSAFRFFNEFMREGPGVIHLAHLWSIAVFVIGYSIYAEFKRKKA
jgi:hypothetical protein